MIGAWEGRKERMTLFFIDHDHAYCETGRLTLATLSSSYRRSSTFIDGEVLQVRLHQRAVLRSHPRGDLGALATRRLRLPQLLYVGVFHKSLLYLSVYLSKVMLCCRNLTYKLYVQYFTIALVVSN
jgi:hypothetical protein